MWAVIAAVAVVVVALAIIVPLVLARGDDDVTETTLRPASTTTSTTTQGTTSSSERPTTTSTTDTTAPPGPPGDSVGEWARIAAPDVPGQPWSVAVSDQGLAILTDLGSRRAIFMHDFASGTTIELPAGNKEVAGIDIDKDVVVWWEGTFDDETGESLDQRIYSYTYPDGPKVEVIAGDPNVGYPQIAGIWATWIEGSPSEFEPEEFWRVPIYGAYTSVSAGSENEPQLLVPTAIAPVLGDAVWTYSLSESYLAWEQGAADAGLDVGSYVMDLLAPEADPVHLGTDAWRPSISGDNIVYWNQGLKLFNIVSGETTNFDRAGDWATAAPTYVAYLRYASDPDSGYWEVVVRGLSGAHEQVLGRQYDPPWFTDPIGTATRHVAFVADGQIQLFEWKPGDQKAR